MLDRRQLISLVGALRRIECSKMSYFPIYLNLSRKVLSPSANAFQAKAALVLNTAIPVVFSSGRFAKIIKAIGSSIAVEMINLIGWPLSSSHHPNNAMSRDEMPLSVQRDMNVSVSLRIDSSSLFPGKVGVGDSPCPFGLEMIARSFAPMQGSGNGIAYEAFAQIFD
jgi:hypothetical protein